MEQSQLRSSVAQFESWWQGRYDGPLVAYEYPQDRPDLSHLVGDWLRRVMDASWAASQRAYAAVLDDGDTSRFERLLDLAEAQIRSRGVLGAGFVRYFPALGPGIVAAFVSGYSRLMDGVMWLELGQDRPVLELDEIIERCNSTNGGEHARHCEDLLTRAARRLHPLGVPISMTDLGGNLDLLSALRGPAELMIEMMERPEDVQRALEAIDTLWTRWYDRLDRIITPPGGPRGCWMQILSASPFYPLQCDFAAMISPEMFGQFVKPSLERITSHLGRSVFHLDGPNMVGHLPHVCSVGGLHAIQWTPGAGNPPVEDPHWHGLYRQIIELGCKVVLLCFPPDVTAVRTLLDSLPAGGFYLHFEGPDRVTGETILEAVQ